MPGNIEFILDKGDIPFSRSGRGGALSNTGIRVRVKQLIRDAVEDIADRVHEYAVLFAPSQSGNLKSAIDKESEPFLLDVGVLIFREAHLFPTTALAQVGINPEKAPYGNLVHGGSGIYGPYRTMITAKTLSEKTGRLKKMRFLKEGVWHFHDSVKGQKPQPFIERAYDIVKRSYAPARILRLKQEIGNLG